LLLGRCCCNVAVGARYDVAIAARYGTASATTLLLLRHCYCRDIVVAVALLLLRIALLLQRWRYNVAAEIFVFFYIQQLQERK
jgi:hypothetical protein